MKHLIVPPQDGHGVVHAEFEAGGNLYHYYCPDARPGDRIKAHGNSPSTVVGLGWSASSHRRYGSLRVATIITAPGGRTNMNEYVGITSSNANRLAAAEQHEAEAKRLRKAEKKARKQARRVAAAKAEQARLRTLALDALAEIAADGRKPAAYRIAAAQELLAATA